MNNLKAFVLGGSYVQLKSVKKILFTITVSGYLHQSPKVGADITLAGRPFQRQTVEGKKDPLKVLIEHYIGRNR